MTKLTKLQILVQELLRDESCQAIGSPTIRLHMRKKQSLPDVRKKLRNFVDAISFKTRNGISGENVIVQFQKTAVFNRKSWHNVCFSLQKGIHVQPAGYNFVMRTVKYKTLIRLAAIAGRLLETLTGSGSRTVRHTYYLEKRLLRDQVYTRNLIHDIAATIRVPRFFLSVYGSCWGSICGQFQYRTEDDSHSGSDSALQTIPKANQVLSIKSSASFVLVIETDATAQALVERKLQQTQNCLIIASRGFPDANTRQIVYLLWHHLQIPVFVLTDCDPSGMEIMCTFRFGSLSMAYDSDSMNCPAVRWLGIFPEHVDHYHLTEYCQQQFSKTDHKKVGELLGKPYIKSNPVLLKCVEDMQQKGLNVELEAFTDEGADLLVDQLIPNSIRSGLWV